LSVAMLESLATDLATLILAPPLDIDAETDWFACGVQELLSPGDLTGAALAPRLLAAIERKKYEREARKAYATDLETGLPHQQQLVEHMSHLMALRAREPAPMALLVLRIEGLAKTQARLGVEAANVLRRKIGVRLRAGVRASDVVAALNDDSFGVLLASMLAPADANRVGAKLLAALNVPVKIAGQDMAVATALGIAQYPQDGTQPDALLRRAIGLAASAQAHGRFGMSDAQGGGGPARGAANDD
jgi:diguanylate cyclase (GGDEF)-like protein